MAYGTLNTGTITPGSGNTLTVNEAVTFSGAVNLGTPSAGVVTNLSGVLPVGVTGGSGLTALGTVASGVLEDAVTYRNINQDLASTDSPTFAGATFSSPTTTNASTTIQNGVTTYMTTFYQAGTTANYFDITVPNDNDSSNSYLVQCSFSIYRTNIYNAQLFSMELGQGTDIQQLYVLQNMGSAGGYVAGYFTVSKPATTTLRITKNAGSNGGTGPGFIRVIFKNTMS